MELGTKIKKIVYETKKAIYLKPNFKDLQTKL